MLTQFDDLQLNNYLSPVSEDVVFFEGGVKYRSVYQYYIKLILPQIYETLMKTPNLYAVYAAQEQYVVPRDVKKKAMVEAYLVKFKNLKPATLAAFKTSVRYMYVAHTNPRFPRREWSPSLLNDVLQEVHAVMFNSAQRPDPSMFPVATEPVAEPVAVAVSESPAASVAVAEAPAESVAPAEPAPAEPVAVAEAPAEQVAEPVAVAETPAELVAEPVAVAEASVEPVSESVAVAESPSNIVTPILVTVTGGAGEFAVSLHLLKKYGVKWTEPQATLEKHKSAGFIIYETDSTPQ